MDVFMEYFYVFFFVNSYKFNLVFFFIYEIFFVDYMMSYIFYVFKEIWGFWNFNLIFFIINNFLIV